MVSVRKFKHKRSDYQVEATLFEGGEENGLDVSMWLKTNEVGAYWYPPIDRPSIKIDEHIRFRQARRDNKAMPNDWLIKTPGGRVMACSSELFHSLYEEVRTNA